MSIRLARLLLALLALVPGIAAADEYADWPQQVLDSTIEMMQTQVEIRHVPDDYHTAPDGTVVYRKVTIALGVLPVTSASGLLLNIRVTRVTGCQQIRLDGILPELPGNGPLHLLLVARAIPKSESAERTSRPWTWIRTPGNAINIFHIGDRVPLEVPRSEFNGQTPFRIGIVPRWLGIVFPDAVEGQREIVPWGDIEMLLAVTETTQEAELLQQQFMGSTDVPDPIEFALPVVPLSEAQAHVNQQLPAIDRSPTLNDLEEMWGIQDLHTNFNEEIMGRAFPGWTRRIVLGHSLERSFIYRVERPGEAPRYVLLTPQTDMTLDTVALAGEDGLVSDAEARSPEFMQEIMDNVLAHYWAVTVHEDAATAIAAGRAAEAAGRDS